MTKKKIGLPIKKIVHTFSKSAKTVHEVPIQSEEQAKREFLQLIEEIEKYNNDLRKIAGELSRVDERDEFVSKMFEGDNEYDPFTTGLRITGCYKDFTALKDELLVFKQEVKARGMYDPTAQLESLEKKLEHVRQVELNMLVPYVSFDAKDYKETATEERAAYLAKSKTICEAIVQKFGTFVNRVKSLFGFSDAYRNELLNRLGTLKEPQLLKKSRGEKTYPKGPDMIA